MDFADPVAQAGEVVVRTEAAALNHLDLWVGKGMLGIDTKFPTISGSDGAGIVESVGAAVDPAWIGKRVLLNAAVPKPDRILPGVHPAPCDISMIGEHTQGCLAERFVAPIANVLDIGDADPVAATAFGLTHLTAWRMMVTQSQLRAGMIVLITGIGGGVALAALNLARHFGCEIIVTSRHQWKLDRARALGAHHVVLDAGNDWSREVRGLTARRGVDLCIDSVGKSIHGACIKSLARCDHRSHAHFLEPTAHRRLHHGRHARISRSGRALSQRRAHANDRPSFRPIQRTRRVRATRSGRAIRQARDRLASALIRFESTQFDSGAASVSHRFLWKCAHETEWRGFVRYTLAFSIGGHGDSPPLPRAISFQPVLRPFCGLSAAFLRPFCVILVLR